MVVFKLERGPLHHLLCGCLVREVLDVITACFHRSMSTRGGELGVTVKHVAGLPPTDPHNDVLRNSGVEKVYSSRSPAVVNAEAGGIALAFGHGPEPRLRASLCPLRAVTR